MEYPYLTVVENLVDTEQKEEIIPYTESDFVYISYLKSNLIDLDIEINNPNDYFVLGIVYENFGNSKENILNTFIIPPKSQEKYKINYPYTYLILSAYITLEFYALKINEGNDIKYFKDKKLLIRIDPSVESLILIEKGFNKKSYYESITISKKGGYLSIDPRTMGVYARIRRNNKLFMMVKNASRRYSLLFSTRITGTRCPYCNTNINNNSLERKNYLFEEEKYILYEDIKSFCYYCFGTGYLGGFYSVKKTFLFLTYGNIIDPETGDFKVGNVITEASDPIKPGDYIFDGTTLFYIYGQIEINSFYNLPIFYRSSITSVSPLSPVNILIQKFSEDLKDIFTLSYT